MWVRLGLHFQAIPPDISHDAPGEARHAGGMETDDDLFREIIDGVTLTSLARIGDDPDARYQFFKQFVELAREVAPGPEERSGRVN
jgi:hypothetical protein